MRRFLPFPTSPSAPATLALAALLLLALVPVPAAAQQAAPVGEEVETFQSWELRCGTPPGADQRVCQMEQDVFRPGSTDQQVAKIAVGFPPGSEEPGMLILTPLATWLPPGIGFQLDSGQEQRVPVQHCSPQGCITEILIEEPLLKALQAGTQINLTIHDRSRQPIKGAVSLLGFTAAYQALVNSRS